MPNSSVFHLMISTAKLSQEGGKNHLEEMQNHTNSCL